MSSQQPPPSATTFIITPNDPSYRVQSHSILFVHILLFAILSTTDIPSFYTFLRVICTLILTVATFALLNARYITLQRTCALRLTQTKLQFETSLKQHTILTSGGMETIFRLLLATSLLSNLPLAYTALMKGEVGEWVRKVEGGVGWWFGIINLTICGVCWVMIITQEGMRFEFEERELGEDDVPIRGLKLNKDRDEWERIASISRRHDIYLKSISKKEYEMTTRFASNHPLFNPDKQDQASGPVLHITVS